MSVLITRFDYDEIFGTVLNRFCVQAVIGHPLTVYGSGGRHPRLPQHPRHLALGVELAVENPAERGDFRALTSSPSSSPSVSSPDWSRQPPSISATWSRWSTVSPRVELESTTTRRPYQADRPRFGTDPVGRGAG